MRAPGGLILCTLLGLACAPVPVAGPAAAPAPMAGMSAQVEAGHALALAQCAGCHGAALEGRYGPALSGSRFQAAWRGRSAAALRAFIAANMPQGRAGTLTGQQTLELVAYVLHANGVPLPQEPLTAEALGTVTLFRP